MSSPQSAECLTCSCGVVPTNSTIVALVQALKFSLFELLQVKTLSRISHL